MYLTAAATREFNQNSKRLDPLTDRGSRATQRGASANITGSAMLSSRRSFDDRHYPRSLGRQHQQRSHERAVHVTDVSVNVRP
jgi:hypothetical protein